jgi:hypothetical protein
MSNAPRPGRRTLLLLLALFIAPLVAAFALYYGIGWRPASQSIHGELISPARPMPAGAQNLRGDWSLLYLSLIHI